MMIRVPIRGCYNYREIWFRLAVCQRDRQLGSDTPTFRQPIAKRVVGFIYHYIVGWIPGHLGDNPSFNQLEVFVVREKPILDQFVIFLNGEFPDSLSR